MADDSLSLLARANVPASTECPDKAGLKRFLHETAPRWERNQVVLHLLRGCQAFGCFLRRHLDLADLPLDPEGDTAFPDLDGESHDDNEAPGA